MTRLQHRCPELPALVAALVLALVTAVVPARCETEPAQGTLALVGARLIDGTGAAPVPDSVILVEADRITAVGSRNEVEIPARATVLNLAGLTILPGFFNCHAHFTHRPDNLAEWAYEGVTTVRDICIPLHQVESYRRDPSRPSDPTLARVLFSGPVLDVPGGRNDGSPYGLIFASPEDARARTAFLLAHDVDVIKVYLEDGSVVGGRFNVMSLEELQAITETAHAQGIPVAAHVQEAYLVERAVTGGVDDIAHSQLDGAVSDHWIAEMVAHDVALVPTLEMYSRSTTGLASAQGNLIRMHRAGVRIGLGTDYDGIYSTEIGMPSKEIRLMHDAGLQPMDIIVAGTANSARICRIEHETGTVEPGKVADLVVVNGDPLADLGVLKRDVVMVFHYGTMIRDDRGTTHARPGPRSPSGRVRPQSRH